MITQWPFHMVNDYHMVKLFQLPIPSLIIIRQPWNDALPSGYHTGIGCPGLSPPSAHESLGGYKPCYPHFAGPRQSIETGKLVLDRQVL